MDGRCFSSTSTSSAFLSSTINTTRHAMWRPIQTPTIPNPPSLPLPLPPSLTITSSLLPRRRGRRNSRRLHIQPSTPSKTSQTSDGPNNSDVELSVDIDAALVRASTSLTRFYHDYLSSGADAYLDLRSSVRVDGDGSRRIVFSCRKSSLRFVATNMLVLGVVMVFVWLSSRLRSPWGSRNRSVVRRDRSLGGREVVVGRRSFRGNESEMQMRVNPLTLGRPSGVAASGGIVRLKRRAREDSLPEWWPDTASSSSSAASFVSLSTQEMDDSQREAAMLVRAIMDNRMSGQDYKEDDVIQLRRICRISGARVHFGTAHARDSFFRASIDFILNVCSRAGQPIKEVQIDGESVHHFLAGLAYNINLENARAVILVRAAVAAKTRSCFLQAWALEVQGKRSESLQELRKISLIHQIFPPEDQSPEIEMVASGLQRILKAEQREHLLNLFEEVSGVEGQRIAAAALGLQALKRQ